MTAEILERFLESATTTEIGIAAALLLAIIWSFAWSVSAVVGWLEWMYRVRRAERLQNEAVIAEFEAIHAAADPDQLAKDKELVEARISASAEWVAEQVRVVGYGPERRSE